MLELLWLCSDMFDFDYSFERCVVADFNWSQTTKLSHCYGLFLMTLTQCRWFFLLE